MKQLLVAFFFVWAVCLACNCSWNDDDEKRKDVMGDGWGGRTRRWESFSMLCSECEPTKRIIFFQLLMPFPRHLAIVTVYLMKWMNNRYWSEKAHLVRCSLCLSLSLCANLLKWSKLFHCQNHVVRQLTRQLLPCAVIFWREDPWRSPVPTKMCLKIDREERKREHTQLIILCATRKKTNSAWWKGKSWRNDKKKKYA